MNTKFLIELIEKNTRVILPEFGAFLVKDDGTGTYKNANITFSPFLRYNDGIVEDALVKEKKISKDQAKTQLNNFIEELKAILLENKKYEIENFGLLYLDKRGSIHFTPHELKLQNEAMIDKEQDSKPKIEETKKKPESPKVVAPKTSAKEKVGVKPKDQDNEPLEIKEEPIAIPKPEKIIPQDNVETSPIKELRTSDSTEPKPIHSPIIKTKPSKTSKSDGFGTGKAILMGTLIGLGLVVLLVGGWYLYSSGIIDFSKEKIVKEEITPDISEESANVIATADASEVSQGRFDEEFNELSKEIDKGSLDQELPSDGEKLSEKRIIKTETDQVPKIAVSYPQEGMFHIIVGSFRNANYAEKFSIDMKSAGYKSSVIAQPSGMHAVSLGSFLTRQEAADSMNQWKLQYPNIWILKQ